MDPSYRGSYVAGRASRSLHLANRTWPAAPGRPHLAHASPAAPRRPYLIIVSQDGTQVLGFP